MLSGPLERGGQPGPAIEVSWLATTLLPVSDRADEVEPHLAACRVVREPPLQAWPLSQQGLVGDLHVPIPDGDEAGRRQPLQDLGHDRVPVGVELVERDAPSDQLRPLARAGQAQEQRPRQLLAMRVELGVGRLGEAGDRPVQAAAGPVGGQREASALAQPPQLEERRGEERQDPRLAPGVGDQRLRQRRLDAKADSLGRVLDDGCDLGARERADEHLVGAQQPGKGGIGSTPAVVVGAQRDDDLEARMLQREEIDEGAPLGLVAGGIEDLLELVDHDHEAPAGTQVRQRAIERCRRIVARKVGGGRLGLRERPRERASQRRERMLARPERAPAATCRCRAGRPLRGPGRRPARSAEDLPLPESPTTPRNRAPTNRATISAISRSRPK